MAMNVGMRINKIVAKSQSIYIINKIGQCGLYKFHKVLFLTVRRYTHSMRIPAVLTVKMLVKQKTEIDFWRLDRKRLFYKKYAVINFLGSVT